MQHLCNGWLPGCIYAAIRLKSYGNITTGMNRKCSSYGSNDGSALERYFSLNKQLRKQLHALIPAIQNHRTSDRLLREVVGYRDILQRVVITPRIQQGLITARDQFAIDTTVYNMHEINTVAGKYGNPGMMLAAQISLSTKPEILISLDRKMRTQVEQSQTG